MDNVTSSMFTNDVITQIQSDKFWYKQIVQALVHTDNYEIFSLVYQRKIEIKLNLANAGIKICIQSHQFCTTISL